MLELLLRVLVNNIAPAFLVIGLGVLFQRTLRPDVTSISRLALYVLSPALVFSNLVSTQLPGAALTQVAAYTLIIFFIMVAYSALTARALRLDQATAPAYILASTLVNSGNFGLSIIFFAFGEPGVDFAIIYFATSAITANTFGAVIASRSQGSWRQSLRGVLRLPVIYATMLAVTFRAFAYIPPDTILLPIATVGQAAVPVMLLILGMQLAQTRVQEDLRIASLAATNKLVVMALAAFGLASFMGLQDLTRAVCIVESCTPTAVTAVLLATEFGSRPKVVASAVFLSTLASAVTLTVVMALLG